MKRLAIIGAGPSGLGAAYALRSKGAVEIVCYEKSRGYGGRATTRRKEGWGFDHGANCFQLDTSEAGHLLINELECKELTEIKKPIYAFDRDGKIQPLGSNPFGLPGALSAASTVSSSSASSAASSASGSSSAQNASSYNYRDGISRVGKVLSSACNNTKFVRETRVKSLQKLEESGQWRLISDKDEALGDFDHVLFTSPAPQTVDILAASSFSNADLKQRLLDATRRSKYIPQFSVMLGYNSKNPALDSLEPRPYWGLVSQDGQHDISFISFEQDKEGHGPSDGSHSLLVVQMSPQFSAARFDGPRGEELVQEVVKSVSTLIGQDVGFPSWFDVQGWRFSQVSEGADATALRAGEAKEAGLWFAGDWMTGISRVTLSVEDGLQQGRAIAKALNLPELSAM